MLVCLERHHRHPRSEIIPTSNRHASAEIRMRHVLQQYLGIRDGTRWGRQSSRRRTCGNPSLRLFGFGPVSGNGLGIGYIIKDDGIQYCVSSKHRQTDRYIETLENYLEEVQDMLIATMPRHQATSFNIEKARMADMDAGGYGFFDAGDYGDDEDLLPPVGRSSVDALMQKSPDFISVQSYDVYFTSYLLCATQNAYPRKHCAVLGMLTAH